MYEQLVTAGASQSFHALVVASTFLVVVEVEAQSAQVEVGSDFLLVVVVDDQSAQVDEELVVFLVDEEEEDSQAFQSSRL